MIEKDERTDHAPLRGRQHPANLESAQVTAPLVNYEIEHVFLRRDSRSIVKAASLFDAR
jgi:hypothetical protein